MELCARPNRLLSGQVGQTPTVKWCSFPWPAEHGNQALNRKFASLLHSYSWKKLACKYPFMCSVNMY